MYTDLVLLEIEISEPHDRPLGPILPGLEWYGVSAAPFWLRNIQVSDLVIYSRSQCLCRIQKCIALYLIGGICGSVGLLVCPWNFYFPNKKFYD